MRTVGSARERWEIGTGCRVGWIDAWGKWVSLFGFLKNNDVWCKIWRFYCLVFILGKRTSSGFMLNSQLRTEFIFSIHFIFIVIICTVVEMI